MLSLEDLIFTFADAMTGYLAMGILLSAVLDERRWSTIKKVPVLLLAPSVVTVWIVCLAAVWPEAAFVRYCAGSCLNLLLLTLWARRVWQLDGWRSLMAVCMAGVFQVAVSTVSWMLLRMLPLARASQFLVTECVFWGVVLLLAWLLFRFRFGNWFRILLEDHAGKRQNALLFLVLEFSMEMLLLMQSRIQPDFLMAYYFLTAVLAGLITGLSVHLAQRLDARKKLDAQKEIIVSQQRYEQNLEEIRQEVRTFRHDYKNLLAGLSAQAEDGQLEQLQSALTELDAGFDRRMGERIQTSAQLGNVRIPQVRSLLLQKLAGMQEKNIDCRLEVLCPVKETLMDPWDFTRCLGILLDNAVEAALETETPWVETILLADPNGLTLRISNPCRQMLPADQIWKEGISTKGAGRGLGLVSYQRLVDSCPQASSFTEMSHGVFIQKLRVEKKQ